MFGISKKPAKPPERYYLFPGMGGEALRRKRRVVLIWAVAVTVPLALVFGYVLYAMNRLPGK
jgi:hypothetical protein